MSIINSIRGRTFIVVCSILGPLLFNIFLNDIFSFLLTCDMCNYTDDNTNTILYAYSRTGFMTVTWSLIPVNVN